MRLPLRGRGSRPDDLRNGGTYGIDDIDGATARTGRARGRRPEPAHLALRTEPHPLG